MSLTLEQLSTGSASLEEVDSVLGGHRRSFTARYNSKRNLGVLHRDSITAVDKLLPCTIGTVVDAGAEAGSNLANAAHKIAVSSGNRYGSGVVSAIQTVTPTVNHPLKIPITITTGAEWYDIFVSTDAAPLWVGRITEAQRLAGGLIISTVGTPTTDAGANPSGANGVNVGIVGTGVATGVNPFAVSNAYTPASVTAVSCVGYKYAHILSKLVVTDLRSLPTLKLSVFAVDQVGGFYFQLATITHTLLTGVQTGLTLDTNVEVDGCTGIVVLVDTISGQGAAASVYVELA